MGCCNKAYDERPIPRLRFWAGLAVMVSAHAFVLVLLTLGAPFSARYRKVRAGWRVYSREVLRSCWAREGFRVGASPDHDAPCTCRPDDRREGEP
jgi:hypothetical protein